MHASVGDQLVQHSRVIGRQDQITEIIEVLGPSGQPPYRVRHSDGHETLLSPGPDCEVRARGKAG
ncbi:DUF1918 domain-containing protein [Streptomyces roseirectus]|uniref:DUF1918 domain-containing protein n=1 Tax=Streptomyces roseirectus TaxID=2768066 RepID=A0A7H0ILR3_9ACTN|nr:DUF1918 domain-containing protein [Streptomyces roseirectus]QNP73729.1 DUF1918 domain-containing protein [Streptomyces roseirectus]